MAWFTSIKNIFTSKSEVGTMAKDTLADIRAGIDVLFYTAEEKAQMAAQAFTAWLEQNKIMQAGEVNRSITRRILAIMTFVNVFAMIWVCILFEALNYYWLKMGLIYLAEDSSIGFTPMTVAVLKLASVFELGFVFITVVIFYFGPAALQFLSGGKK